MMYLALKLASLWDTDTAGGRFNIQATMPASMLALILRLIFMNGRFTENETEKIYYLLVYSLNE